ncbi:MAG: HlyD family efflux transporter periplasmic adaptor subunit [Pseudolabrys sp.]
MPTTWKTRAIWGLLFAFIVVGLVWFAWPSPIPVDLATVSKGPMEVTVDDEGKTRVRHIYTVSAPIAGKVLRISHPFGEQGISVHVGDQAKAAETIVAVMQPTAPSFLDVRSREELQAMLTAADAAVVLAEAEVRRIEAALEFSRSDLRRSEALARTNSIPERTLEKVRLDVATNEAALASAKAQHDVRRSERASVAARLINPSTATSAETSSDCCIQLRAPATGVILKIIQDSEAVVTPGTPLIDIGNPIDLEVVADLLSTDAVQIKVGAPVRIDGWGGRSIEGRVVRVDPAGFLKVSALGIEEQRVRTTIDFSGPPEEWSRLGHDYRVIVHVTVWAGDVLNVPVAALFRQGEQWAVYLVNNGRAQVTEVTIGHRNNRIAEVVSGLSAGGRVVLHPSDRISSGVAVAPRETH